MLKIFLVAAALLGASAPVIADTCNAEARATCEAKGGTWNSSNCSCS